MIDKLWIKFFYLFFLVFTFLLCYTSSSLQRMQLSQAQLRCGNEQFHTYLWTKFRLIWLANGERGVFWSRPADKFSTSDVFRPIHQESWGSPYLYMHYIKRIWLFRIIFRSESTDLFVEDPAFLPSFDLAPLPPPPLRQQVVSTVFLNLAVCRRSSILTGEGRRGLGRRQIRRWRESLVLYKSFLP